MTSDTVKSSYAARLFETGRFLGFEPDVVTAAVDDLCRGDLVASLAEAVRDVPEFSKARFADIDALSLFRTMLYVIVRLAKPAVMVETGVLNGFGSSFILQAMADNNHGRLVSIDLPLKDLSLFEQGSSPLPKGKEPGWAIPASLRRRHELRLGPAERLLPEFVLADGGPDIFMHDSDHAFTHLIMELSFMWSHMKQGLLIVDNVEQNDAFSSFAAATGRPSMVVSSYDRPDRRWQHGLLQR